LRSKLAMPFLIFSTLLLLLKVYIANELYYTSRNIQKLTTQIDALKEEKNILKLQIEKLKYKNTIIDPLFNYQPKEIMKTEGNSQINKPIQSNESKTIQVQKPKKTTKELFDSITVDDNGDIF